MGGGRHNKELLDSKKAEKGGGERLDRLLKCREVSRLWETIRNIIKRRSSECKIELVRLVDFFSNLFHKDKGMVPLRETRITGPVYMEELDSGLMMKEIRESSE